MNYTWPYRQPGHSKGVVYATYMQVELNDLEVAVTNIKATTTSHMSQEGRGRLEMKQNPQRKLV